MTLAQVCGLFPPPDRTAALRAVGRMILNIRRQYALTAKEIAASLPSNDDGQQVSDDTILRAEKGETLLSFDRIAQLAYKYPEGAAPVLALFQSFTPTEPTTLEDRLKRAEEEILFVRRELDGARKDEAA